MKPILQWPKYELGWPAFWLVLLGLVLTVVAAMNTMGLVLATGVFFLVIGIGIWQELRLAILIGLVATSLMALIHLVRAATQGEIRPLAYAAGFLSIAYGCWDGLKQQRQAALPDGSLDADPQSDDDDEPSSMISLVLLLKEPRYLESTVLRKMVESAWDCDFGEEDDEDATEFVVGESPLFVIQSRFGMFLVHNFDVPYWEDVDEVAEEIGELRLRKAVTDHRAWLSVDALGDAGSEEEIEIAFEKIGSLICDLAGDDALAILKPNANYINLWSEELAEQLTQPGGVAAIADYQNVPVVPIDGSHPLMIAAVEEARECLPQFIETFETRSDDQTNFCVKAKLTVNENTEFIWVDVLGFEPETESGTRFLHGVLGNDPVDLGELKIGNQIEVPFEDICDWGYLENGEPQGMFSVKAIAQIQSE